MTGVALAARLAVLGILLFGVAACGNQGTSPSETGDPALLEAGVILQDPLAERILRTLFNPERQLAENGAVGLNRQGYLGIRPQADGSFFALASGIARSDDDLIERGVRALEFGLPYQNPDGSFARSSVQDTARFGLYGLRAYTLLANSPYAEPYADRLETIFAALSRTETYLLGLLPEHPEIYTTTNQVAMLAYALTLVGQEAEEDLLLTRGHSLLRWVLAKQREDGVFPERGGHDSHYQAASLMALSNIYLYTDDPAHQEAIYPALLTGFQWQKSRISADGRISDEGNTRTAKDPADSPENKRIDPREIALTLLYLSYLGPEFTGARDLGERVLSSFEKRH